MGGTYRSLLAKDQQKSCQTKAEKAKDRCKALALLWKAFQQRHPHGTNSSTGSRYEKALQQTVDHYCKRRSSFCGMAKDLQTRYKSAMAQGKLGTYRSLLAKDQQKSCQTKAEKAKDRCKALALLWKAFQQRHPHGSSSSTGSRYEKALQQTVDHYCKRRSSFCGMAKDLQARYKSAMAQGNLGTYRSLLAKDQQKSCQTKAEKAKDRCKALALLWKAFQQRHPHGTNSSTGSRY